MSMEAIIQLEERFNRMTQRIRDLEQENRLLKEDLETERASKRTVQERIEQLLNRIQEEIG